MALYRHVGDSDALVTAVLDRVAAEIPIAAATGQWMMDLRRWAVVAREVLAGYPGASSRLLTVWFKLPSMLVQVEQLLAVVEQADLDDFESVASTNAVLMFVLMRVEAERVVRGAGVTRRTLRVNATGDLTRLRRLTAFYEAAQLDTHFEYGLDVLLAGISTRGER
ncbi:MAG: TetR/AcrR family transcriptional regulator C-terminal domain-containing protein, partial [Actinomycetota bacterium]